MITEFMWSARLKIFTLWLLTESLLTPGREEELLRHVLHTIDICTSSKLSADFFFQKATMDDS